METREGARAGAALAVATTLAIALLVLPFVVGSAAERLKDRHSDPALGVPPPAMVAVTQAGKLYHDPRCRFIHGPASLEPWSAAVRQGLTPCPRCLGRSRSGPAPARSQSRSFSRA